MISEAKSDSFRHEIEAECNNASWEAKPVLKEIYGQFHRLIRSRLASQFGKPTVELGSGICRIKDVIPDCICTDCHARPGIDQVEDCYQLSFANESVANLIMFDVFHHLQYPGHALEESYRVLSAGGRLLIFEPALSLLGWIVYGMCHAEPIGYRKRIDWNRPEGHRGPHPYYAAQGNAHRVFVKKEFEYEISKWRITELVRSSSFSYVTSGGFSRPQLYPTKFLSCMRRLDTLMDFFPSLFATRMFVVIEK